jgi:hypothetical protein
MTPSRVAALVIVLMLGSIGITIAIAGTGSGNVPDGTVSGSSAGQHPWPRRLSGGKPRGIPRASAAARRAALHGGIQVDTRRGGQGGGSHQGRRQASRAAAGAMPAVQQICRVRGEGREIHGQNAASCGIPAHVVASTKANHGKMLDTRQRICSAALGPGGEPKGPGHLHFDPLPDHVVEPGMLERREQVIEIPSGRHWRGASIPARSALGGYLLTSVEDS